MNQFAKSGTHWPRGIGFPDEAIHVPAAIVTTGDDTHYGHQGQLGDFRLMYEQGWLNESTGYPVLPGLGNHDVSGSCGENNCALRMFDYVSGHLTGAVTNFDPNSDNYSWDWNGVHYIQLNTFAGDTKQGTGTHISGLGWLAQDLLKHVGISYTPIVIFQHYGYDCFSLGPDANSVNSTCAVAPTATVWWNHDQRQTFWNVLQGYNVVAMFTGHVHSTGMYDMNEFGGHLDDFVGGTGGEDPCLAVSEDNPLPACGGRGHFFVIRRTGNFLDVASLEWTSDTNGKVLTNPTFTNLSPAPSTAMADYAQGPSIVNGQLGCRKLINSRIVDLSGLIAPKNVLQNGVITITNTSGVTIPGPIALEFEYMNSDLTSKSFVDQCAAGGNSYMYPDNASSGSLAPGKSLSFTAVFAGQPGALVHLVRAGLSKGASNVDLVLTGSPKNPPPAGTITVYGPPNTGFTMTPNPQTATPNWVAITPTTGTFNKFGTATLTYTPNATAIANDKVDATEITFAKVTTSNPLDEVDLILTLHLRVSDSITFSINKSDVKAGNPQTVTAVLHYKPVTNPDQGGTELATGVMTLYDITNPAAPVVLTSGNINSGCDPSNDPNCPQEPPNTAILPAVTLSAGVHNLQIGYNGDSFYEPNTSVVFAAAVGQPVLTLTTQPSALALTLAGKQVTTPFTENVGFNSSYTLAAPASQAGTTGVRYLFDHWADDGTTGGTREVKMSGIANNYIAVYNTQYLVRLAAVPSNGGTIAATDSFQDDYYPAGALETVTATPAPGYYFTGFTGGLTGTHNPQTPTISAPVAITANFAPITAPKLTWAPVPLFSGQHLGAAQLNATANVAGSFTYTPAAGVVPPLGLGYVLNAIFKPQSAAYSTATATTWINVAAKAGTTIGVNLAFARSSQSSNISLALSITNVAPAQATNVVLTSATIDNVPALALPAVPNIAGYGTTTVGVAFPGTAGAKGSKATMTLTGTSSGGPISYTTTVTLP